MRRRLQLWLDVFGLAAAEFLLAVRAATVLDEDPGPCCALCTTPAGDMPVNAGETWHCTPCAIAIVEVHAIYHHGRSSAR